MKQTIIILLFLSCSFLFFAPRVLAVDVLVSGTVNNESSTIQGGSIVFKDTASQQVIVSKEVDVLGNYAIFVPQGTYDISFNPPHQSGLQPISKRNQHITSDTHTSFDLPKSQNLQTYYSNDNTKYIIAAGIFMLFVSGVMYFVWKKNK